MRLVLRAPSLRLRPSLNWPRLCRPWQVHWDSSGRFLASVVANARMDNGYAIYTFFGHQMYQQRVNDLSLFQWRPRPPSLLSSEQQAEIHRQLKEYSRRFDEEDQSYVAQVSAPAWGGARYCGRGAATVASHPTVWQLWGSWQVASCGKPVDTGGNLTQLVGGLIAWL